MTARLLIVDDSEMFVTAFQFYLSIDRDIEIVGVAKNGLEAVQLIAEKKPNVVTMDINMPVMNGMDAIRQIMRDNPVPIIVLSDSYTEFMLFDALKMGAYEVMPKPTLKYGSEKTKEFISKLKLCASLNASKRNNLGKRISVTNYDSTKVVGIVSSLGGPKELQTILSGIDENVFNACVLIVQHMSPGFKPGLCNWISTNSKLNVSIARNGDKIKKGYVYFAPDEKHMIVSDGCLKMTDGEPYNGHKPSGDMLLKSIANNYKSRSVGIVLTGCGRDGAEGIAEISRCNGLTICQDPEESLVDVMPYSAIETGRISKVLCINDIKKELLGL